MTISGTGVRPRVAYYCMEYGLDPAMRTYSGGLGILAGGYLKGACDGWWPEACKHGENGWQYGDGHEFDSQEKQDAHDSEALSALPRAGNFSNSHYGPTPDMEDALTGALQTVFGENRPFVVPPSGGLQP